MNSFEKTVQFIKQPWFMGLYLVLLLCVYAFIDKPLALYFHHLDLRSLFLLKIVTLFGSKYLYVALFFLLALFFRFLKKNSIFERRCWYFLLLVLAAYGLCFVLKILLGRARPELLFSMNVFGFYWLKLNSLYWSMPSGHSFVSVGVASGLGVLAPRFFPVFLALAVLVMLSRVLLYYHYLTDVLLAFYLCILFMAVLIKSLKKISYFKQALSEHNLENESILKQ